jgi:glucose/arabinose dehydrogenase
LVANAAALSACISTASPVDPATVGPDPRLPEPHKSLIPTVQVAEARGWPQGSAPTAPPGVAVTAFASGLQHPRWIYVLPNGDVLVAETDAPARPDEGKGFKGRIMSMMIRKAGSGTSSANRITLLRDADGDGVAETRSVFLEHLNSPFGMALVGNDLYVANTDAVMRYPYQPGHTRITDAGTKLADLPAGARNHHWTKSLIASPDGTRLYATVGSNSNVAENGIEEEEGRAAIWEIELPSGRKRLYATGLRNANGMAWEPVTHTLWTVVNERDELGNDLVPDFLTSVKDGGFYGWPYSWYGSHVDDRVQPPRPDLVQRALKPDYSLGAHVAALGLAYADRTALPAPYAGGMFIGEHGSWNRKPPSGYKVVFVPFANGKPSGLPVDMLTGFLGPKGEARGRPVGVAIDRTGALLVADDVGNTVWRARGHPAARP